MSLGDPASQPHRVCCCSPRTPPPPRIVTQTRGTPPHPTMCVSSPPSLSWCVACSPPRDSSPKTRAGGAALVVRKSRGGEVAFSPYTVSPHSPFDDLRRTRSNFSARLDSRRMGAERGEGGARGADFELVEGDFSVGGSGSRRPWRDVHSLLFYSPPTTTKANCVLKTKPTCVLG